MSVRIKINKKRELKCKLRELKYEKKMRIKKRMKRVLECE